MSSLPERFATHPGYTEGIAAYFEALRQKDRERQCVLTYRDPDLTNLQYPPHHQQQPEEQKNGIRLAVRDWRVQAATGAPFVKHKENHVKQAQAFGSVEDVATSLNTTDIAEEATAAAPPTRSAEADDDNVVIPDVILPETFVFPYQDRPWILTLYWLDAEHGVTKMLNVATQQYVAALEICQIQRVPDDLASEYPACAALAGTWHKRISDALTTICTTVSQCKDPSSKRKVRSGWANCYWLNGPAATLRLALYRQQVSSSKQIVRDAMGHIYNGRLCEVAGRRVDNPREIRQAYVQQYEAQKQLRA